MLLESGPESVRDFVATRGRRTMAGGAVAAVVVNCNPFTLATSACSRRPPAPATGCMYLCAGGSLRFPYDVRRTLVRRVAHIPNMTVHDGGQMISQATFPSYFTRDPAEQVEDHAALDATIFGRTLCLLYA